MFKKSLFFSTLAILALVCYAHAADIYVNSTEDTNVCDETTCTLRGAVAEANKHDNADTIYLDTVTYALNTGLVVKYEVTFLGQGSDVTIIDGQKDKGKGMIIFGHAGPGKMTFKDLTITNGFRMPTSNGGAISANNVVLEIENCVISNNKAGTGAGIYFVNDDPSAVVRIINSKITGNKAYTDGGGIYSTATVVIKNSTISNNSADNYGGGVNAALFPDPDPIVISIDNSSITGNSALVGGALFIFGANYIDNTTITGNSSKYVGSALYNMYVSWISNSTITGNTAQNAEEGAAVYTESNTGIELINTILQGNDLYDCSGDGEFDIYGGNIIGNTIHCTINQKVGEGDYLDQLASLTAMQDNGLPGGAFFILQDGIGIDTGTSFDEFFGCSLTDQLGLERVGVCDSGAVEARCGDGVVQTTIGEECDDGNLDIGDGCDGTCKNEVTPPPKDEDKDEDEEPPANPDENLGYCGDGVLQIDAKEECDDGNADAGDGCSPICESEEVLVDTVDDVDGDGNPPPEDNSAIPASGGGGCSLIRQ